VLSSLRSATRILTCEVCFTGQHLGLVVISYKVVYSAIFSPSSSGYKPVPISYKLFLGLIKTLVLFRSIYEVYPKISGLSHNKIYAYKNKHSLRMNTKGYGGKSH
jgi:hypothetical protein